MSLQAKRQLRAGKWMAVVIVMAFVGAGLATAANDGTITSLSATDAPNPGQTITISAALTANAKINNSNVYY